MFPDILANKIEDILVSTKSWEKAVDILVTNHPESGSAVIQLREKIFVGMLFVFIKFQWQRSQICF